MNNLHRKQRKRQASRELFYCCVQIDGTLHLRMQGPFFRGSFWNHTTNHIGGNCYGRKKRIQRSHRRGYLQKRKECTNAQSQLIVVRGTWFQDR